MKAGEQACCYTYPGGQPWLEVRCDCKYGGPIHEFRTLGDPPRAVPVSTEKTGCCELRIIHMLLSRMTDEQYTELLHSNILI